MGQLRLRATSIVNPPTTPPPYSQQPCGQQTDNILCRHEVLILISSLHVQKQFYFRNRVTMIFGGLPFIVYLCDSCSTSLEYAWHCSDYPEWLCHVAQRLRFDNTHREHIHWCINQATPTWHACSAHKQHEDAHSEFQKSTLHTKYARALLAAEFSTPIKKEGVHK